MTLPRDNITDNDLLKLQQDRQEGWTDAFGNQVSHGISNSVDIPSFYTFNPERLRYYKNGTRIRYRDIAAETTFTDRQQDFLLEPASGDTLDLYTAERPRYIVGVDVEGTQALYVPTGLNDGDTLRYGLSDKQTPENALFFEVNGGDADNRIVATKGGTETASDTWEFPGNADIQTVLRWGIRYNWYGAGPATFSAYYTDSDKESPFQEDRITIGQLSNNTDKLVNDANFHIFAEIDATSSDLDVSVGSFGFLTFGDVGATERTKASRLTGLAYDGTGDYEPLAAVRIDPDRGEVFSQLTGIEAVPDGGDGELLAVVVPEEETDATGFATPVQHSPGNSVIEETTNVTTFPDQDGNIVTSDANPNGYQVGFFATDAPETGTQKARATTQARAIRPVYEDDVVILLYKDDDSQSRSVNIVYNTKQLW